MTTQKSNNIALPFIALFWVLSLFVFQGGGPNVSSRVAALRASSADHTLSIDRYLNWTIDWSLSPNGHYYSNKAPGAFLAALPIFMILDRVDQFLFAPLYPSPWTLVTLCILLQILPLSYLVWRISGEMGNQGGSVCSRQFFVCATLLGNTAAIYANTFFGHTLAAIFVLAAVNALFTKQVARATIFMSCAVLTDYMALLLLPGFLFTALAPRFSLRKFAAILLAALPGTIIFAAYHALAFGKPWRLASGYTNPAELPLLPGRPSFFGAVGLFPELNAVWALLFGMERGILFTQPWVLISLMALLFSKPLKSFRIWFASSFVLMLWMNASVGGWHGGWSVGPRYLCLIFPSLAWFSGQAWDSTSKLNRRLLIAGLTVAITFRIYIFPFSNIAPVTNLWSYFAKEYVAADLNYFLPRILTALLLTAICFSDAYFKQQSENRKV